MFSFFIKIILFPFVGFPRTLLVLLSELTEKLLRSWDVPRVDQFFFWVRKKLL